MDSTGPSDFAATTPGDAPEDVRRRSLDSGGCLTDWEEAESDTKQEEQRFHTIFTQI